MFCNNPLCSLPNQKLLCEDRFVGGLGTEVEVLEKQLLSQMLEAIRVTPCLNEDLQVEVMKVRTCYFIIKCCTEQSLQQDLVSCSVVNSLSLPDSLC